jgi:hypothetical protein
MCIISTNIQLGLRAAYRNQTEICNVIHDLYNFQLNQTFGECVVVNGLKRYARVANETIIVVNSFCEHIGHARKAVIGSVDIDMSNHQVLTDRHKCGCRTDLTNNVTKIYVPFNSNEINIFKHCSSLTKNMYLLSPKVYERSYEILNKFSKRKKENNWGKAAPSTGFMAVIYATQMCERVRIIGYTENAVVKHHFIWTHHDIESERKAIQWFRNNKNFLIS